LKYPLVFTAQSLYVGNEKAYQHYQRLAVEKKIAEDKRMAAEMNMDAAMNWNMWGPWVAWWQGSTGLF
jgi:hypothetical protein